MTPFQVVVTETAERHLETIQAWWAIDRRDAPLRFTEEIEATFQRISQAPSSGALYSRTTLGTEVRRVLLRRTRHHVYYTCDTQSGRAVFEPYGTPLGDVPRAWGDPLS